MAKINIRRWKPGGKVILIGIHSGLAQFNPTELVRGKKSIIGAYGYEPETWQRTLALLSSRRVKNEAGEAKHFLFPNSLTSIHFLRALCG